MILDVPTWTNKIVGGLSASIDLDNEDRAIRLRSENYFKEEIEWAYYLGVPSIMCCELKDGDNSNYAAMIAQCIHRQYTAPYWIPVTIMDSTHSENTSTWKRWSLFHKQLDFCAGVQPCLRLVPCSPPSELLQIWKGEPIDTLLLAFSLFEWEEDTVSLPEWCKELLQWYQSNKTLRILIEGTIPDEYNMLYKVFKYLNSLYEETPLTALQRQYIEYNDLVQIPLQPLMDNLQSSTYDVFEKDHTKYILYERAIYEVLCSYRRREGDNFAYYDENHVLLPSSSSVSQKGKPISPLPQIEDRIVITLVGAGRGPLILCALRAAKQAKREIVVYALDKNPNAIVTLHSLAVTFHWGETVHIVECDMRTYRPAYYSDIILSELLGSFGDNELSPECLVGAQRYLLEKGEFIPRDSLSLMSCCMSSRVYSNVKKVNPAKVALPLEATYVVHLHNVTLLSDAQPVFSFTHPDQYRGDFRLSQKVSFSIQLDGLVHGFAGYFESHLSEHVLMSIAPSTHSEKLNSWFPLFIPIVTPFYVKKGDVVDILIWRRSDSKRVWYEWCVTHPIQTIIHNINGKGQWIGLYCVCLLFTL